MITKTREDYLQEARERASRYYYTVLKPKMAGDPEKYRELARLASLKKRDKRRGLLRRLREEMGGKCSHCPCDIVDILQFHHHEDNKDANVTEIQSLKKIPEEAKKCMLLCPNCHAIETLKSLRS